MYIRRNESNTTSLEKVDNSNASIHVPASLWDDNANARIAVVDVILPEDSVLYSNIDVNGTNASLGFNKETSDGNSINTISIEGPITKTSDGSIPEYITIEITAEVGYNISNRHKIDIKVYFDA